MATSGGGDRAARARFGGRVALVTGSASGLGRLIALGLGAEGAAVAVVDVEEERAREVAAEVAAGGGRALGLRCDVAAGSEVERAARTVAERLGPVDVLVNNAAVTSDEELVDKSEEAWDREVDITLKGAFLCARAVLPGMVERGRGAIVSIGSVNGLAFFGNEAYSAAKAGLVSLTRSIAVRYGPRGVRANLVAPGTLRTPAWDTRLARDPAALDRVARWYPLGRVGEPEEVVGPVLFLLSDEAAWISGAVLPVDGGLLAGNGPMAREILGEDRADA